MRKRAFDISILVVVLGLVLFGIVMVFSASYYTTQSTTGGSGLQLFIKQMWGASLGFVLMILAFFVDYRVYRKPVVVLGLLLASVVFLVLVLFIGDTVNGAKRWLNLGIKFQPSEVARFAVLLFVAAFLSEKTHDAQSKNAKVILQTLWVPLGMTMLICALILLGKNLSMTMTVILMVACLLAIAGLRARFLSILALGGMGFAVAFTLIEPYRIKRLLIFPNPWKDPKDTGYQLIQSLYALGAGNIFGVGLGNSRQKFLFLSYGESDFILSIIGEELGFLGIMLLLAAFMVLIWRGMLVATKAPDTFGMLLATGITSMIAIQLIIHVAVVTSSMPPTGLSLPFISNGNSSLMMFMGQIGILLNISRRRKPA